MLRRLSASLALTAATLLTPAAFAQITVNLNTVIGSSGTNAADVDGVGNPVNLTGVANNSGATTLTAGGSANPTSFNFNSEFSDTLDRVTGSMASAGAVIADMKHDSGATGGLVLDTNNDGVFAEGSLPGFGVHGDTFITFDLDVIRTNAGVAPGSAFALSGLAGQANWNSYTNTAAAILADSTELAVFDWTFSPVDQYNTFTLFVPGSTRYLTFIALSGLDLDNYGAHVGFANVQLIAAVPEPSTYAALAGLVALAAVARRRWLRAGCQD